MANMAETSEEAEAGATSGIEAGAVVVEAAEAGADAGIEVGLVEVEAGRPRTGGLDLDLIFLCLPLPDQQFPSVLASPSSGTPRLA